VTFLGTYLALRRGQHIAMTLVRERLRGRAAHAADIASAVMLGGFLAVLAWYGARYAWTFRDAPTPYLELPTGLGYAALPVGAVLLGLAVLGGLAGGADERVPPMESRP
jgi:TRAP-type transport system small permease protein